MAPPSSSRGKTPQSSKSKGSGKASAAPAAPAKKDEIKPEDKKSAASNAMGRLTARPGADEVRPRRRRLPVRRTQTGNGTQRRSSVRMARSLIQWLCRARCCEGGIA